MDKMTDVSGKKQATPIIPHLKKKIKQEFIGLVYAQDLTSQDSSHN